MAGGWVVVLALAFCHSGTAGGVRADELPPVETFEMGQWTLLVARDPFRLSWLREEKLVHAERYRRSESSVRVFKAGRWLVAGAARGIDRKGGDRVTVQLEVAGSGLATVEITQGSTGADPFARWVVEMPGAGAIRDDIVPSVDEELFVVSGLPKLILSSRGYALWLSGTEGSSLEAYAPDPDSFRLEAWGARLAVELWPAAPKEALQRRARVVPRIGKGASADLAPIQVRDWASLRAAVEMTLADSLSEAGVRSILPTEAGTEGELGSRVKTVISSLALRGESRLGPVLVEFPGELDAWRVRDAWLLGTDTLVAPILTQGSLRRKVWLPPGDWRPRGEDWSASPPRRGPAWIEADVPLGEAAVYLRVSSDARAVVK